MCVGVGACNLSLALYRSLHLAGAFSLLRSADLHCPPTLLACLRCKPTAQDTDDCHWDTVKVIELPEAAYFLVRKGCRTQGGLREGT